MLTSLAVLALSSCNNDDTRNTNYTKTVKPIVSVTAQSATSIVEGDRILVTLETNTTYKEDMDFKLELDSGTGTNADYFMGDVDGAEVGATSVDDGFGLPGYKISFPAYATTHSFYIYAATDIFKEDTENLRFILSSTDNMNGLTANGDHEYIDLEITNFASDELGIIVEWSNTVNYKSLKQKIIETDTDDEIVEHSDDICDIFDIDFYVDDFSNYAFTGACPEISSYYSNDGGTTVANSALADGTYNVVVDLWDLDFGFSATDNEVLIGGFSFPVTVTIARTGNFNTTFTIPNIYASNTLVSNGNGGAAETVVATIIVAGGKYTVNDANGNLIAAE